MVAVLKCAHEILTGDKVADVVVGAAWAEAPPDAVAVVWLHEGQPVGAQAALATAANGWKVAVSHAEGGGWLRSLTGGGGGFEVAHWVLASGERVEVDAATPALFWGPYFDRPPFVAQHALPTFGEWRAAMTAELAGDVPSITTTHDAHVPAAYVADADGVLMHGAHVRETWDATRRGVAAAWNAALGLPAGAWVAAFHPAGVLDIPADTRPVRFVPAVYA